jgi:hypothetical protein
MSVIRGALLAGGFRSQQELNGMSREDMRNSLIVELIERTRQSSPQSFNNETLAGMGALLACLRAGRMRNDTELKGMTADDMRNTLIAEIGTQTQLGRPALQGMTNIELVLMALGKPLPGSPGSQDAGHFMRGVLLAGGFRPQRELTHMSPVAQRQALIAELARHSTQTEEQDLSDAELAGAGAVMAFLRSALIRSDAELALMSTEEQRSVAIAEIEAQTKLGGAKLQDLGALDLVLAALGVDPVFKPPPTPSYVFSVDGFRCREQRSDNGHSDSNWLTMVLTVIDPVSKAARVLRTEPLHMEASVKRGSFIKGPFQSVPFELQAGEAVMVNCLVMNLGASNTRDQFNHAVSVTNQVVSAATPTGGAVGGFIFGSPKAGFKIGKQITAGFEAAVDGMGQAFDFLGRPPGPPNCNGEVLSDTFIYQPGQWVKALNEPASKQFTGPPGGKGCGSPAESTLHFSVQRFPAGGLFV